MQKRPLSLIILITFLVPAILYGKVVDTKALYTVNMGTTVPGAMDKIHNTYNDFTEVKVIGYSTVKKRPIKAIKVGKGKKSITINAAHHGRESMTTILTLDQIQSLCEAYKNNSVVDNINVRETLNTVSIWFIPLVNPDGVDIAMSTKPSWKANGRGVDLNRNYDTPKATTRNIGGPRSEGYCGTKPFSENETLAIKNFYESIPFESHIAYHSAGEVNYWWWYQTGECLKVSKHLLALLTAQTGYAPVSINNQKGGRGCTDWTIQRFNKPGFTLEIGKTVNAKPLAWWEYAKIWEDNKNVPIAMCNEIIKLNTGTWKTTVLDESKELTTVFGKGYINIKDAAKILEMELVTDASKQVNLKNETQELVFTKGDLSVLHNGMSLEMELPCKVTKWGIYIPNRFVIDLKEKLDKEKVVEEENNESLQENEDSLQSELDSEKINNQKETDIEEILI